MNATNKTLVYVVSRDSALTRMRKDRSWMMTVRDLGYFAQKHNVTIDVFVEAEE